MDLSVIIPVRNEAENIVPLLTELRSTLDHLSDYEVIYVDDGSTDNTAQCLAAAQRDFPRLRVLRHRVNRGQSTALLTGIHAARGTWIVTLDGDGQNDPADIPKLLAARAASGDDASLLLTGYRLKRCDSRLKRWSSRIANAVRTRLLNDATPDTGCSLKLFARATYLALPQFDHMHRFLPALILRAGGHVQSVAVNHRKRERGRSNYGVRNRLWIGIVDLCGVMWLRRRPVFMGSESIESIDADPRESLGSIDSDPMKTDPMKTMKPDR